MVYRGTMVRHRETVPLRLPQEEIDTLVRSQPLCCSHFDAFRFFAPAAQLLNHLQPDLWAREDNEQPGCIHANMDLYKWAAKSLPWVPSELLWKCFHLALKAREIDMRASPYDLSGLGYEPIAVETAAALASCAAASPASAAKAAPASRPIAASVALQRRGVRRLGWVFGAFMLGYFTGVRC